MSENPLLLCIDMFYQDERVFIMNSEHTIASWQRNHDVCIGSCWCFVKRAMYAEKTASHVGLAGFIYVMSFSSALHSSTGYGEDEVL